MDGVLVTARAVRGIPVGLALLSVLLGFLWGFATRQLSVDVVTEIASSGTNLRSHNEIRHSVAEQRCGEIPPPTDALAPGYWAKRLYTPAGHNRLNAYEGMPSEMLAPWTVETQAAIYANQFPSDCSRRPMLITKGLCNNGLGSLTHVLGDHLGLAIAANRTLVYHPQLCPAWRDNTTCPEGPGRATNSMNCFFAPIASCTYAQALAGGAPVVRDVGGYGSVANLSHSVLWTVKTRFGSEAHVPRSYVDKLLSTQPDLGSHGMSTWGGCRAY